MVPSSSLSSLTLAMSQMPSLGRVVVVGGGASGLAAGRHLKTFGFEVTILEARVSLCDPSLPSYFSSPSLPRTELVAASTHSAVGMESQILVPWSSLGLEVSYCHRSLMLRRKPCVRALEADQHEDAPHPDPLSAV